MSIENDMPLVSIITVTFNAKIELEKTILSVIELKKEHGNIEFIIIDGGSKDGSCDILHKYSKHISYSISEPDHGIYDAMNKGWKVAKIDSLIIYLGAGDKIISLPRFSPELTGKIIYGNAQLEHKLFKSKFSSKLKLGNTLHHQALLVPKKIHPAAPFNTKYKVYADFDFNQRLMKSGACFIYEKHFLASVLPDGISSYLNITEMTSIVRKNFGCLTFCLSYIYLSYQRLRR
jgi:glycosyltransferase involved in cell wall biosynthesis